MTETRNQLAHQLKAVHQSHNPGLQHIVRGVRSLNSRNMNLQVRLTNLSNEIPQIANKLNPCNLVALSGTSRPVKNYLKSRRQTEWKRGMVEHAIIRNEMLENAMVIVVDLLERNPIFSDTYTAGDLLSLEILYLAGLNLTHKDAPAIAAIISSNSNLNVLLLDDNHIGCANHVAKALKNNQMLQTLSLSNTGLGCAGAKHLAEALEKNQTLQELSLSNNGIGCAGAKHLAEALEKNQTLLKLWLETNHIGEISAQHLAKALEKNQKLEWLLLNDNHVGDLGAKHLAEALEKNQTLRHLHLRHNGIGDVGTNHLAKALEKNQTLKVLDLQDMDAWIDPFVKTRQPRLRV